MHRIRIVVAQNDNWEHEYYRVQIQLTTSPYWHEVGRGFTRYDTATQLAEQLIEAFNLELATTLDERHTLLIDAGHETITPLPPPRPANTPSRRKKKSR